MTPSERVSSLSPGEYAVARHLAQGLCAKEVAAKVGLSPNTVKVYTSRSVYPKLGVTTQAGLIRFWIVNVELSNCGVCPLRICEEPGA